MPAELSQTFCGKKVLIAGGYGFIGSNLALRLLDLGAHVAIADSLAPGCGGNKKNLELARGRIKIYSVDLADQEELRQSNAVQPNLDYVFTLAGSCSHVDSQIKPALDLRQNVLTNLNLLEQLKETSPEAKIVHASTRQVYGRPTYLPVDENHPVSPIDFNGIHKLAAEQYHRMFHDLYGLRSTILRLSNSYGPRQLISHDRQSVTGAFFGMALRGQDIPLFGGGLQRRDFCFIDDIVEAFLLSTAENCDGETFNLSGEAATLKDFASKICAYSPDLETYPADFPDERRKIDIGDIVGSAKKFHTATGWKPKVGLEEGIQLTLGYFREHAGAYL